MNISLTKISLVLLNVVMIVTMLLILNSLHSSANSKINDFSQLQARKEDLLNQQQSLDSIINNLNKTLALEASKNQGLKADLASLNSDSATAQNLVNELAAIQEQQLTQQAPKPVVIKQPVTRAS